MSDTKKEVQKKQPVTAYVEPDVLQAVRGLAAQEEVTVSEAINALLKRAVMHRETGRWYDLFGPAIENRITQAVGQMSDRLSTLIARTALESTATREMLRNEMLLTYFLTYPDTPTQEGIEKVNAIRERAWKHAVNDLRKPSEGVRELLANVKTDDE